MTSAEWTRRVFSQPATAARMLSLHDADPGATGRGMLGNPQRINPHDLAVERGVLTNPRELAAGPLSRGGRARYVGFWTADGAWIGAVSLRAPTDVVAGQTVTFASRTLRLELV